MNVDVCAIPDVAEDLAVDEGHMDAWLAVLTFIRIRAKDVDATAVGIPNSMPYSRI
jgi:hypothetical protein